MDFQEYVAARRTSLVRAAVLLGAAEVVAPKLVRETLLREAARIERLGDPDPAVFAALVVATSEETSRLPTGDEPGLDIRRTLASMAPTQRAIAVLAFHADLTPHETADALGLEVDTVDALEASARTALGAADTTAARDLMMLAGGTVPPPPGDPIVRPVRSARWPVVAAVAVVALGLTAAAVSGAPGPGPGPGRRPDPVAVRLRRRRCRPAAGRPRAARRPAPHAGLRRGRHRGRKRSAGRRALPGRATR